MVAFAQIRRLATHVGREIVDAMFPIECAGCGDSGGLICGQCSDDLPVLSRPFCEICCTPGDFARCQPCAESTRWFDGVRSPYRYAGVIRQAILALKYGGIKAGSSQLGDLLADYLTQNPLAGDVVAPVPMHGSRLKERGYNQADLLARRVARRCDLRYAPGLLVRTRSAEPQAGIDDPNQRTINVAGSVELAAGVDVSGVEIILLDDVATTGSTLEECARALKQGGARSVWCLTLARSSGDIRNE